MCDPLRQLTHKDNLFQLPHAHDEALHAIKQAVCNATVLRYFDSKLETTIQCDASDTGLGV
ncbi:hypothetical protein DPMN_123137 [Dreissena polymorpha]|uniref:Reverse transcriptase/retrotransposon-derived protein RNase H-like domain-containing protein n=1 Tax=Dreissena polymorpha TaxID=45954 RepID=A0A9D4JUV1_DREPO|nr:hypothetical protein DPMN_123137 [Dreissena polymorpha]